MEHISSSIMKSYLKTMSKSKARTLSILGKQHKFVEAMNTETGAILLQDLIDKHERLLDKVGNLTATEQEKIEYKVVHEMVLIWAQKIDDYYQSIKKIEAEVIKNDR
jgi:hypothetical protein